MRMLRSIFNQAYQQGIPDTIPADELFRFVFTGYEPTAKRAISPALIRRLSQLNLEHSPNLRFSRDLFLLSFYLRGIPFVDLVHLRKTDMKHNTIYYYRRKTRQQLSVYLEPYAAEILRRYADKHSPSPYLLPILSSVGPEGYRQYKSALRLYNQHLHRLSKMLRLSVPLTSYVARHSWATTAKEEGVAIAMISEGLGHSSEKVTHVYLASFNNNAMSKANRKVFPPFMPKRKREKETYEVLDFYSGEEVMSLFKVRQSWLYTTAKRNRIPICRIAGKNYYSKKHVDEFFGVAIDTSNITDWLLIEEAEELFGMKPSALRAYAYRHKIPTKREYGRTYYSKSHLDELRRTDLVNDERYYTVEQVRQIYGLSSANISHIVKVKHIEKVKVGVKNLLLRSDVERVMAEREKQP